MALASSYLPLVQSLMQYAPQVSQMVAARGWKNPTPPSGPGLSGLTDLLSTPAEPAAVNQGMNPDTIAAIERAQAAQASYAPTQSQRFNPRSKIGAVESVWDAIRGMQKRPELLEATRSAQRAVMADEQEKFAARFKDGEILARSKFPNLTPDEIQAVARQYAGGEDMGLAPEKQKTTEPTQSTRSRNERLAFIRDPDNAAIFERMGTSDKDKFLLTGNWSNPDNGLALSTNPDGTFSMSYGQLPEGYATKAAGATGATQTKSQADLTGAADTQRQLDSIGDGMKRSYLTYGGAITQSVGKVLAKAGLDTSAAEYGGERKASMNALTRQLLAYRKSVTGVAGGEKEMAKIEESYLNGDMSPQEFKAAIEQQVNEANRLANVRQRDQGLTVVDYPDYEFNFSSEADRRSTADLDNKYGID